MIKSDRSTKGTRSWDIGADKNSALFLSLGLASTYGPGYRKPRYIIMIYTNLPSLENPEFSHALGVDMSKEDFVNTLKREELRRDKEAYKKDMEVLSQKGYDGLLNA